MTRGLRPAGRAVKKQSRRATHPREALKTVPQSPRSTLSVSSIDDLRKLFELRPRELLKHERKHLPERETATSEVLNIALTAP